MRLLQPPLQKRWLRLLILEATATLRLMTSSPPAVGALKLTPLSRIRLADLLYTSLEVEADREWNRKAIAECESRYEAYKNGEMGSSEGLDFLDRIESKSFAR